MRIIVPEDDGEALDLEAARVERRLRRGRRVWRTLLGVLATASMVGVGAFVALAQTSPGHGRQAAHTKHEAHRAGGAHRSSHRGAKPGADPPPQAVAIVPPGTPPPTAMPRPGEAPTSRPRPAPAERPAPAPTARTPQARPRAAEVLPLPVPSLRSSQPARPSQHPSAATVAAPVQKDLEDSYNYGVPALGTLPGQVSPAVPNPAQALVPSLPAAPVFTPNALPAPAGGFLGGR
jgi:hypothetical protein